MTCLFPLLLQYLWEFGLCCLLHEDDNWFVLQFAWKTSIQALSRSSEVSRLSTPSTCPWSNLGYEWPRLKVFLLYLYKLSWKAIQLLWMWLWEILKLSIHPSFLGPKQAAASLTVMFLCLAWEPYPQLMHVNGLPPVFCPILQMSPISLCEVSPSSPTSLFFY